MLDSNKIDHFENYQDEKERTNVLNQIIEVAKEERVYKDVIKAINKQSRKYSKNPVTINNFLVIGDNQYGLTLPVDSETKKLARDMRFAIDFDDSDKPDTYILSNRKVNLNNYEYFNRGGTIILTLSFDAFKSDCDKLVDFGDDKKVWICDYKEPQNQETNTDDWHLEIEYSSLKIKPTNKVSTITAQLYDKDDNELLSTRMIVPALLNFNVYDDIQEDIDNYIITYNAGSDICPLGIQKNVANVEYFINQIYLYSKSPQIPYNLMTEMMFRCLEINSIDLTGSAIAYEMLARRVCRKGDDTFAYSYGKNPNIDQFSYTKLRFREAVQRAGVLQAVLFQDISAGMNIGLSQTLNGKEPTKTPLETIIKS